MHIGGNVAGSVLEILRLELAMFVVAIGLFDGDGNSIENVGRFLKDSVHLFQGAVACFGEEEVDDREDECVSKLVSSRPISRKWAVVLHDSEDDISLVPNVGK